MSYAGGLTKTLALAKNALKAGANWFSNNATSLFGGLGSVGSAFMSYQAAKKLMDRQNKFTEYMSNTAHQREVNDLREAGLNPILSAMGGSGATTPASGSGGSMSFENPMNSALAWRQQKNNNKLAEAEVNNKNADSHLKGNQANTESENFNNAVETGKMIQAQTAKHLKEIEIMDKRLVQDIKESNARINEHSANASFQRRRSGGYTRTESGSNSHSGGRKVLGTGFDESRNSSWSNSITY